ncbi:MAG: MFS transporter [Candidatus Poseidonia sp.]|uniref:MFS transporter n=1 Tax=Poseidonia sp. TaxID=2666344 RepID=UPI0030BE7E42|nr:MFS transporter [Poseidonia sp.]
MSVNMQDSRAARFTTVCALYFAQGVPWFFIATALVTFLVDNGSMDDDQKLALIAMGMIPWIIGKLVLGPVIDRYQFKSMGRRRPWVLISQIGMMLTMAAFLLVDDPAEDLKTLGLFFLIHNIFAALQDVSSDALAVDTLKDEELSLANGLMFVAKGLGAMFAVLGLSRVLNDSGFQSALLVQIPILFAVMLVPLFIIERPGDKRFPWSQSPAESRENDATDAMTFGEILNGFRTAVADKPARLALLLCTVMWIGGGMGTGMGIIDHQWEFLFVENLDWDSQKYLDTKGAPVFLMTMLGFLVGGLLGSKFGTHRTLTYAVGIGTVMTVLWSVSRSMWNDTSFMLPAWLLWTLVWAIVGANLLAFLMSITTKDIGGTQFSIYMTLINVGAFAGNALSPQLLDFVGGSFPNLFLTGAVFQAIVLIVLLQFDADELKAHGEMNTVLDATDGA